MTEPGFLLGLDHVVLTVRNIEATCEWYERVLGMRRAIFDGSFVALHFGVQKINLHPVDSPQSPHARLAQPGTADLCFISSRPIEEVKNNLERKAVPIELGPVPQTGAQGQMDSVYVRDPDGNLIEIASYREQHESSAAR